MSNANEVMQRLRRIGFEHVGEPGIPGDYVSDDDRVPRLRLDASFHLALSSDRAQRAELRGAGSIYVHPVSDAAPVELCDLAVIFATGPYVEFLSKLAKPSGRGTTNGEHPGWCGHAAELLVAQLERQLR